MAKNALETVNSGRKVFLLLITVVFIAGLVFSLIHPLGLGPDEAAHVKYIKFIADHGRLPVWEANGGGEAGYESQHPPLYYSIGAMVYRLSSGLPEN